MSRVYHPEISAKIMDVMADVAMSNNGYSQMPAMRADVKRAVESAGYIVKANPAGIYGPNGVMVFSPLAWENFVEEQNFKIVKLRESFEPRQSFDYEAAILAKNVDYLLA